LIRLTGQFIAVLGFLALEGSTMPNDHDLLSHLKAKSATMKAFVYKGPGKTALEKHARPVLKAPNDAIIKMSKTTICGTDLHIIKGDVPTYTPGRILGHEGTGGVDEVGSAVTTFKTGDLVLISCVSSCGKGIRRVRRYRENQGAESHHHRLSQVCVVGQAGVLMALGILGNVGERLASAAH
jgi:threonine dehydrogenase-like Zn-dependent dehydrogenase